jgi:hypothetical protein
MWDSAVIDRAQLSVQEFQLALVNDHSNHSTLPQQAKTKSKRSSSHAKLHKRWTKPENNIVKVNSDANLAIDERWGLGAICHNS